MTNALGGVTLASGDEGVADPGAQPVKGRMIEAVNIIQWCLYYPGVLHADEIGLTAAEQQALSDSIAAYRAGVQAMGLKVFAEQPNSALTVIAVPQGVDGTATLKALAETAAAP